jgi:hypothetical protein
MCAHGHTSRRLEGGTGTNEITNDYDNTAAESQICLG